MGLKKVTAGIDKAATVLEKTKDKVVSVIDQDGDGDFDLKDVTIVSDAIGDITKRTATAIKEGIDEKNRENERKALRPIFAEDLDSAEFFMSKLIRITDIDKKRAESEVCKGSIGYIFPQKELQVVNIFTDKVDEFGLIFSPDRSSEIYYVDPTNRDRYIALDEYFNYLKVARVSELQKIAQDLGAKYVKVTYKEEKTSFSKNHVKAKIDGQGSKNNSCLDGEIEKSASEVAKVEIVAETSFAGQDPVEPELKYLQRDPNIQSLISMRMNESSPLSHQKYTIRLSTLSGIKEKDALKIDAALKAMKISGNTTVTNEVKNEARRFFEYEIEF